eukprot:TRINITY_DN4742_c0_g2_i1.p1 TRINITY_DN4742_c0_g2~~TRINITY_DN4742_c0_g2_i1.p1  ORF type:complete len:565 (-),score=59.26 TRINITY_DN4742_c0_g2_i1:321-1982(-)
MQRVPHPYRRLLPPTFISVSLPVMSKSHLLKYKVQTSCSKLWHQTRKIQAVQRAQEQWEQQQHQININKSGYEQVCDYLKQIGLAAVVVGVMIFNSLGLPAAAMENFKYSYQTDIASEWQDNLNGLVRKLDVGVDSVLGGIADLAPSSTESQSDIQQKAKQLIQEVYEVVAENYMSPRDESFDQSRWAQLKSEALNQNYKSMDSVYRAVRVMLAEGLNDPYSRFISPPQFEELRKYDMSGVGLNLGTADEMTKRTGLSSGGLTEGVWVVGVIRGAQAYNAGVDQGDQILEINGQSTDKQTPFEVASLLSNGSSNNGNINSDSKPKQINIVVRKQGSGEIKTLNVERPSKTVAQSPVSYTMKTFGRGQRKIGFIRLTSFNALAQQEVTNAVQELRSQGATEFVLDLRDNRGGLVQEGIEVAKLFLQDNSVVVQTKGPNRDATYTSTGTPLTNAPLSLLVNGSPASASEILAGALRDNCRAVLSGSTTYGKGLIQSVYELSDSSGLAITVGKYVTPGGTDIDKFGIQPDFQNIPSREMAEEKLKVCRTKIYQQAN